MHKTVKRKERKKEMPVSNKHSGVRKMVVQHPWMSNVFVQESDDIDFWNLFRYDLLLIVSTTIQNIDVIDQSGQ